MEVAQTPAPRLYPRRNGRHCSPVGSGQADRLWVLRRSRWLQFGGGIRVRLALYPAEELRCGIFFRPTGLIRLLRQFRAVTIRVTQHSRWPGPSQPLPVVPAFTLESGWVGTKQGQSGRLESWRGVGWGSRGGRERGVASTHEEGEKTHMRTRGRPAWESPRRFRQHAGVTKAAWLTPVEPQQLSSRELQEVGYRG